MTKKASWGILGMGVMGTSLSRNFAQKGISLAVFNRYLKGEEEGVAAERCRTYPELETAQPFEELAEFVEALERPRKILVMVPSGPAIESVLEQLLVLLSPRDILIDGGNSYFEATEKRDERFTAAGISFLGMGVSGGEEGALKGPALMVGGHAEAFDRVKEDLAQIAAKNNHGVPCLGYFGRGGAGHYVKMVHNGVEYAEMQLLAEVYECLLTQENPSWDLFTDWQQTESQSYLLGITASIVSYRENKALMIEQILDKTGHKGTGSWSSTSAITQGVPATLMQAALNARFTASRKEYRTKMAAELSVINTMCPALSETILKKAYDLARWVNHHQGFELLKAAKTTHVWSFPLSEAAKSWTAGCIIQSELMQELTDLLDETENLLETPRFKKCYQENSIALQELLIWGLKAKIPLPVFTATWQYLMAIAQTNSSGNFIQAQRDFFGGHGLEWKNLKSNKGKHGPWHTEDS
ncbi:MAG: NADP-dependent phosphogluconate dehydrogenase [Flavobacteriaceae bacterium]